MKTRPTIDYERGLKHCSVCDQWLPLDVFGPSKHKNGGCGLRSYCKLCQRLKYPKPRMAAPQKTRKEHVFDIQTREELRECSKCGVWCKLDGFYVHGGRLSNLCKPCERNRAREQSKAWYHDDPERARAYAQANADQIKERMTKWRLNNPERLAEHNRSPEKRAKSREYMRQKRLSGEAQAYQHEYARRFPEKGAEKAARRRATIAGVTVEPIDRAAIIKRDGRWCYLCNKHLKWREVTLDHVIPLARGGSHTASNLRVACGPCNFRKREKSLAEYAAYLEMPSRLLAPTLPSVQALLPLF